MTYPHEPFPDGTDLFPHWKVVLDYLQNYATKHGLYSSTQADWEAAEATAIYSGAENTNDGNVHCRANTPLRFVNTPAKSALKQLPRRIVCNRELYSTTWVSDEADASCGHWQAVSRTFPAKQGQAPVEFYDKFDTIIDATGHLVHPSIPDLPGKDLWRAQDASRKVIHSAFYRGPEAYAGKTVLIVGTGPSGLDGALQIGAVAKKVR